MDLCTYPVGGEGDVGGAEKTGANHVSQGVVLLVESEDGRGGQA
jgi:hypothetical protein